MRLVPLVLLVGLAAGVVRAQSAPAGADVDVTAYHFRLTLPDGLDRIASAEATVSFTAQRNGVEALGLDLVGPQPDGRGMTAASVTNAAGAALAFRHDADRLTVTLPRALGAGESADVTIAYAGMPADGLILGANRHGERVAFGDNWPERARHWLPTVDRPDDKATVAWTVTAPAGMQVVANGRLVETTDAMYDTRVWRYAEGVPIPTYGMVVGVARFAVQYLPPEGGVALESWAYPQDREAGFADLALARRPLDAFARLLGPYAFERLAGVQSTTIYGGMENPTAIFYDEAAVTGTGAMEPLIAHEVAHHWFGNVVTPRAWPHLWVSEGFATYLTDWYVEQTQGRDAMAARMMGERAGVFRLSDRSPALPVVDTLTAEPSGLLNANSYQKGAWVLHMLRREVGEAAFVDGLRAYYAAHRLGNANTDDVRRAFERASGRDLRAWFDQWLRRGDEPELDLAWRYEPGTEGGALVLTVRQTQPGPPFTFPLDVGVRIPGEATVRRLAPQRVEAREASLRWPVATAPAEVVVDPDTWLLARWTLRAE